MSLLDLLAAHAPPAPEHWVTKFVGSVDSDDKRLEALYAWPWHWATEVLSRRPINAEAYADTMFTLS